MNFFQLHSDAFQQLASISAVLGGLAFTAAAAIVAVGATSNDSMALNRASKLTIATAMISAIILVFAALMWSLMAADILRAVARDNIDHAKYIATLNWIPSVCFLSGTLLFYTSIGVSGWIASRKLGIITLVAAIIGCLGLILLIIIFADINK